MYCKSLVLIVHLVNTPEGMGRRIDKVPKKFHKRVEAQLRAMSAIVQARRKALGLTQEHFAEKLDISLDTVKAIESGRRFPSLPMLFYICLFLKIDLNLGAAS